MRILLTNDDGIRAPGLSAMYGALLNRHADHAGPLGEVLAVAPLNVQSATSHGVTFHQPLMTSTERIAIDEARFEGVAVDGRPADCVKLAVSSIWPERFGAGSRPDLLISGMNNGANCGINVIYSGTVAAAIEGAFLGIPSIAVSLMIRADRGRPRFDVAARHARTVIDRLLAAATPEPHECLSINIPVTYDDGPLPAVHVCPMNTHGLVDRYERRVSPGGDAYYWPAGDGLDFHATEPGSDVNRLLEGCITVTPLRYDLTAHDRLGQWRDALGAG